MDKLRNLSMIQKTILIVLILMVIVFSVLYPLTISKEGYEYLGSILPKSTENGNTVYSGTVKGKPARFVVGKSTVTFTYGDKIYGPYICFEDPDAVPKNSQTDIPMKGIEIRDKNGVIFRGGVADFDGSYLFAKEDGTYISGFTIESNGTAYDANGDPIDMTEPSVHNIYELIAGPALSHKGNGLIWLGGTFICVMTAVLVLFADELFRYNLSFIVKDPEGAEPSDWHIGYRHFTWIFFAIVALFVYIFGLRA